MLPWNYGFHFGAASYIFMGAFYTVLLVVSTTFLNALWRAKRDLSKGKVDDTNKVSLKMRTHQYKLAKTMKVTFEIWKKS